MDNFANLVTNNNKKIVAIFIVAAALCVYLSTFVGVNYNMVDYLPPEAQSTVAINIMTDEFGGQMPNANVMVKNVSIREAAEFKKELSSIDGVTEVLWLDDVTDILKPIEMLDPIMVEDYYKDGNALYTVTIREGDEITTSAAIRNQIGGENALAGEASDLGAAQQAAGFEVMNALVIVLPIIILLLVLTSSSWIEPFLYLGAIGISILINMGTNIFFGEISFMTNSISPILQLAVSMDYAIFLLHSFADERKKHDDVGEAMRCAIKKSFPVISASAVTTLFGFMALMFMSFRIGADLGLVLVKGIVLSFVTVMIFLPALTLLAYKIIDKTKHRPFMPEFRNVNKVVSKLAMPAVIIICIVVIPAFLGQSRVEFNYGSGSVTESYASGYEKAEIIETFGNSNLMVLLVPKGDIAKEKQLEGSLEKLEHVTSIISYANQVGETIPPEFLDKDILSQFYSENYARIIVNTDTPEEGDIAFGVVEQLNETAKTYYGEESWSAGQSTSLYDMKNIVTKDNMMVTLIAVISIFFVIVVTFRSALLPFLLLLTIESAIWINLAIPYFAGTPINFIGYLVLNTVQLGATIDYAILLTVNYMANRKTMLQKEAIHKAMGTAFRSILVSAAILSAAGFTLYATSTNAAISDIGLLLGRGTILTVAAVICFLPGLLRIFDKAIARTTKNANFLFEEKYDKKPDDVKTG